MTSPTTLLRPQSGRAPLIAACVLAVGATFQTAQAQHSAAREWNELLLTSIRNDFARPTVHARNLYHVSLAMWDAWATYDDGSAQTILFDEDHPSSDPNVDQWREEALSYAAYQILKARFVNSPGSTTVLPLYDALMGNLGYSTTNNSTVGNTPSAIGNRIAAGVLAFGATDNSNEANDYANLFYAPVNSPLLPAFPGNPTMTDPNRWQPLSLQFFVDQSGNPLLDPQGNPIPFGVVPFLSPEWGQVKSFALSQNDLTVHERDGFDYWLFHDPGEPPLLNSPREDEYKTGFEMVAVWSAHLDPADGVMIDISPNTFGNSPLPTPANSTSYNALENSVYYDYYNGGDPGTGYATNPVTGQPYAVQMAPRADYARCLAEFWADGPDSETPPGHWFDIANYVSDHPATVKQIAGTGPIVSDLEWDVKLYMSLGGAMHDCAIAAWGVKGWYDYLRPVSAIRYIAGLGQSSNPLAPNYHPDGITLRPGYIETITIQTTQPGQRHAHLAGNEGKIAILAWKGPDFITDPAVDVAGVDWILAEEWWPYQRPTFVTPPFAGYVSGHSTYSRAAAYMMHQFTGSPYFPAGLGEFPCLQNQFLVFEEGPSQTITLQWASYYDASDQTSLSRIWGGIHPPADDIPGRIMGQAIGEDAFALAEDYWAGTAVERASYTDYGAGCAGSGGVPTMSGVPHALPVLGGTFEVDIANLPVSATSTLMTIGLFPFAPGLDLTPLGAPTCTLDTDFFLTDTVSASGGEATWVLPMPTNPFWLGRSLYLQTITLDLPANTLGLTTSNAGDAFIGR